MIEDLTNKQFGRWTVLKRIASRGGYRGALWLCKCICGTESHVQNVALIHGSSRSCGCLQKELASLRHIKHGQTRVRQATAGRWYGSIEYELLRGAKGRAKKKQLSCNIELSDIVVPEFCPILGIKLNTYVGRGKGSDDSPSLDRIIPALGYTKGNIRVISIRANLIKKHGTIEDFEKIIKYLKGEI